MCNGAKKCGWAKQLAGPAVAAGIIFLFTQPSQLGQSQMALYVFAAAYLGQMAAARMSDMKSD